MTWINLQGQTSDKNKQTVLVVDDQPVNVQIVYEMLKHQYRVLMATSGKQAIEVCKKHHPDLVLMDIMMPVQSGLDTCRLMKQDPELFETPVIFLTGSTNEQDENECWEAGCVDFISKPVNNNTLKNRVKVHLTLKIQSDQLRQQAFVDGLTGIKNRRYFDQYLQSQFAYTRQSGVPLTVFIIDIDKFKLYNDHYGHVMGDEVLRRVAHGLSRACHRPTDLVARYGGEEFALVLPDTDVARATTVAERLREEILALEVIHQASDFGKLTISVGGVIGFHQLPSDALLQAADKLLYEAKHGGRNRACIGHETPDGLIAAIAN